MGRAKRRSDLPQRSCALRPGRAFGMEQTTKEPQDRRAEDSHHSARIGATTFLGIVGLVITAAQVWMVHTKDDFDKKSKEFDVIVSLFQKCASDAPGDQAFANRFIGVQPTNSLANYDNYFANDANFKQALAACSSLISNNAASSQPSPAALVKAPDTLPESASTGVSEETSSAHGPDTPSAPPNDGARYWIFLGTYADGTWKTKYLNIPDRFNPATFNPATDSNRGNYKVLAAKTLNVRYGSFSPVGEFPPPTKVLQPGQSVILRSTAQWFISG